MRIAYFTGGNLGAGHLVRGLAVGRALDRAGVRADYRLFGPSLPFALAQQANYRSVPLDLAELSHPARAKESILWQALLAFAPELLLVDCYWAPLRHLLPLPGCEAWLLARWLPARWFDGRDGARWEPRQYRRIFSIEPSGGPGELLAPVVVCNPNEAKPRGALRARLGVADGAMLRVVAHTRAPGEAEAMAARAGGDAVVLTLYATSALFPLAAWLGDADEIIAAAGYNTFWEACWLDTAARTRFTPLNPEQRWRLSACAEVAMRENGADQLAAMIAGQLFPKWK